MKDSKDLESRIKNLEERSQLKDANKAWETSFTRRILIALFTYLAVALYFNALGLDNPWLNAIVPSAAFLLSTLSLPFFKQLWQKYIFKKTG